MSESRYPERIIPEETSGGPLAAHLKRYDFAKHFCNGKIVLDAACGVGYGSYHLGKVVKEIIGVDISEEAIAFADEHYKRENVTFRVMDVEQLEFPERRFDVVCSFETIEHLNNPQNFLSQVKRVLKEEGILLVSTPYVRKTINNPRNSYHITEFCLNDFEKLLRAFFKEVQIYGQRRIQSLIHYYIQKIDILNIRSKLPAIVCKKVSHVTGTKSWHEVDLEDFVINKDKLKRASELIAICSDGKINIGSYY